VPIKYPAAVTPNASGAEKSLNTMPRTGRGDAGLITVQTSAMKAAAGPGRWGDLTLKAP